MLVELAQLSLQGIVGTQQAGELSSDLVERDEGLDTVEGEELGDRMTVDGDPQPLALLHTTQELGRVVAELALWHVRRHTATA